MENLKSEYCKIDFGRPVFFYLQQAVHLNQAIGPMKSASKPRAAKLYQEP